MFKGQFSFLLAFMVGVGCLFLVSCTKSTMVPMTEWRDLDSNSAKQWEVKTGDLMYRVSRFDVTDSTLVLLEVSEVLTYDSEAYPPGFRSADTKLQLPVELRLAEIKSIQSVGVSEGRTTMAAVGILAFVMMLLVVAFAFSKMSSNVW